MALENTGSGADSPSSWQSIRVERGRTIVLSVILLEPHSYLPYLFDYGLKPERRYQPLEPTKTMNAAIRRLEQLVT